MTEKDKYKGMQMIDDPINAAIMANLVPLAEHHSLLFIGNLTAKYLHTASVTVSHMLTVWKTYNIGMIHISYQYFE
jgi:hypothetical protein